MIIISTNDGVEWKELFFLNETVNRYGSIVFLVGCPVSA